ncbi:N-acetylglucosaminyl-diphospho-decaprenol L-rhamnosyltransferase [Saccharopolyspora lacisalsi]|uniref:N-acetylglucosaminyl-diphospho-decaprenol L-rhamnosyltransferase n=1 Tax=Halosaccharopolyspora lacisalsi TaxID=1000566 RepID=A0A839E226_9PSEU|nr:glycosyltransferase family 2 protein [Halosaccharopolyspora lacisalsi]MBA8826939.1 N-acetylglucosaminyl-diphospho-decaprenol L-rhamnosyltransferase [Halosaccharopolyspora lacisalsi]
MTVSRTYGDELAVVTVTYSPGEVLERFLETLPKATDRRVRVILADNGSTDGAPQRAAERPDVDFVPMGANLGYGSAANRGIAELGAEYGWVAVANPDVEWGAGCLDELLAAAARWPRGGAFGPLITEPDGSVYPSARLAPSLGRGAGHALLCKVWPSNPWTRAYRQETAPTERTAGWLSGSCLLLRREALDSVTGFDPRYFMYFEDVDLGDRLGRAGWLNVYVPGAEVMHIGGHSTARASTRMLAEHHRSAYRYLADRHRGAAWAPLRLLLRAGLAVRARLEIRAAGRKR